MSLLTEEQIGDILDITNVCFSSTNAKKLIEWNEKQPSTQFEPDWEKTSSNATKVYLDAVWFNSEMKEIDRTTICGWNRPVTPHPHAVLMTKYAEVAQRRRDPWVEFEIYSESFGNWVALEVPTFFDSVLKYRHIGDAK